MHKFYAALQSICNLSVKPRVLLVLEAAACSAAGQIFRIHSTAEHSTCLKQLALPMDYYLLVGSDVQLYAASTISTCCQAMQFISSSDPDTTRSSLRVQQAPRAVARQVQQAQPFKVQASVRPDVSSTTAALTAMMAATALLTSQPAFAEADLVLGKQVFDNNCGEDWA